MPHLATRGLGKPAGYANGVVARGRTIFVAGQIGWNAESRFESDDFVAQIAQALSNIVAVLACDGAGPEHVTSTDLVLPRQARISRQPRRDRRGLSRDHRPPFSRDDRACRSRR